MRVTEELVKWYLEKEEKEMCIRDRYGHDPAKCSKFFYGEDQQIWLADGLYCRQGKCILGKGYVLFYRSRDRGGYTIFTEYHL